MPTNANLWGSDDEQDFLKPKKSQAVKETKKSSLFDSDEDKELELDLLRMKEAFKTRIHAAADKSSVGKGVKKPTLFDYDDESPIKESTKSVPPVKKSSSGLFDEFDDEDDDELFLSNKPKPMSAPAGKTDFEALYKAEKMKSHELEQTILKLRLEIAELRKTAGIPDPEEIVESTAPSSGAPVTQQPSEEWERLAQEEKERRQRARAMKSKSRPVSKRLSSAVGGGAHSSGGGSSSGSTPSLSSTNTEKLIVSSDTTSETTSAATSAPKLSPLPTWDESDSEPDEPSKSSTVASSSAKADSSAPRDIGGDASAAAAATEEKSSYWETLAEQEKERKAQARRSRAIVRGGSKPKPLAAAVHTSAANSTTTSRSQSPMPGKPTTVVAAAASAVAAPTASAGPADNRDLKRFDSSGEDSGWDSHAVDSDSEAPAQRPHLHQETSKPSAAAGGGSSGSVKAASVQSSGGLTEEAEAELDNRLIDWVRGCRNNIKRLLQTVHTVYHGTLPDLESLWDTGDDDDGAAIRKAYL